MFFKRNKVEVVPSMNDVEYEEERVKYKYASRKDVAIATAIPVTAAVGFGAYQVNRANEVSTSKIINEPTNFATSATEPTHIVEAYTPLPVNGGEWNPEVVPVNAVADASLSALATILDPVIDILVAISFPIASLIVVSSFFLIMIGKEERAFDMMMKAGLGYVLIQLSPIFLDILKKVGDAV